MWFTTQICSSFGLMRWSLASSFLAVSILINGCVYALRPSNLPSQQKLCLQAAAPKQYSIQVADKFEYPVPSDGRVIVEIPPLERGCATYLFGIIKVSDRSPQDVRAVNLKREGRIIKKLSLNDLAKLPTDGEGYRLIKLK